MKEGLIEKLERLQEERKKAFLKSDRVPWSREEWRWHNESQDIWKLHDWPNATTWRGACPLCGRCYSGFESSTHCFTCSKGEE